MAGCAGDCSRLAGVDRSIDQALRLNLQGGQSQSGRYEYRGKLDFHIRKPLLSGDGRDHRSRSRTKNCADRWRRVS